MRDLSRHSGTRKVVDWLEGKGYAVEPGVSFACFWEEKKITYRPQDSYQCTLFGLLHECGHVLVSEAVKRSTVGVRYKRGYPDPRYGKRRSNLSAADVMHEEIEAWHRGFMLARRLGIRLDVNAYWQDYGRCIKRYFKRLLDRKV